MNESEVLRAYGYVRKTFLMDQMELARARRTVVKIAEQQGAELTAIHIEEIETEPEAFHDLLAAVMQNEQRMIIAPDIHHFEVAGEPASVLQRLESNGITIIVGD
jgi:hypothetical protein